MSPHDLVAVSAQALDALARFQRDGTAPREARRACEQLARDNIGVTLIAQRERWSGAHHYEAIVDQPGVGAATLAFCADRGAPWLVRNASRLDDDVVARIDGVPIRVPEAIELLDLGAGTALADQLVTAVLIRDGIERAGLADAPVADADLQCALDDFRAARGLHDAAATQQWLDVRGLTLAVLERALEDQVRARMLRDRIAEPELAAWFAAHRAELDRVTAGVARLSSEELAREAARRARAGSLAQVCEALAARVDVGYAIERWTRDAAPAELRAALFDQPDPVPCAIGCRVVHVIARRPCTDLDERTRRAVRDRVFAAWLARRRAEARVEWTG